MEKKVHRYRPLWEHQYYVVALVHEEDIDIQKVVEHCMSGIQIKLAIDANTGEATTETEVVPRRYTAGYASLLWGHTVPCGFQ